MVRTEADDFLQVVADQLETGVGEPGPQPRRHGFPQAGTPEVREAGPADRRGCFTVAVGPAADRRERQPHGFAAAPEDDTDRDPPALGLCRLLERLDGLQDDGRLDLGAAALGLEFLEQAPELELAAQFRQRLVVRGLHS